MRGKRYLYCTVHICSCWAQGTAHGGTGERSSTLMAKKPRQTSRAISQPATGCECSFWALTKALWATGLLGNVFIDIRVSQQGLQHLWALSWVCKVTPVPSPGASLPPGSCGVPTAFIKWEIHPRYKARIQVAQGLF